MGSENTGNWDQNKRVGVFRVVDKAGVRWTEQYAPDGKRTTRKKVLETRRKPIPMLSKSFSQEITCIKDRQAVPNPNFAPGAVNEDGTPSAATIDVEVDPDEAAIQVLFLLVFPVYALFSNKDECMQCWSCNGFSRPRNNHAWACRTHGGKWAEEMARLVGEAPPPGVWYSVFHYVNSGSDLT